MRWKLGLNGDDFDLSYLAGMFTDDPRVERDGDDWFLTTSKCDQAQSASEAHGAGRPILEQMNGIARLSDRRHKSVSLSGRIVDTTDESGHAVVLAGTINLRSRVSMAVVVADGENGPTSPRDEVRLAEIAATDPEVARVLGLLDREASDQDRLWRAFELVRNVVGGGDAVREQGLASASEMSAFSAWANRPEVSGEAARHEVMSGSAPKRSMSTGEAWAFVRQLVTTWAFRRAEPEK
jgi:hypothetical protein